MHEALNLDHPANLNSFVNDSTARAIFKLATEGVEAMSTHRISTLKFWQGRKTELAADEQKLHEGMPKDVAHTLKGKSLLLMGEMLKAAGSPDVGFIDEASKGFGLTGIAAVSNLFVPKFREPAMSEDKLATASKWTRKAVLGSMRRSADKATDEAVWSSTQEELRSGWLSGPFTEAQISQILKRDDWPVSKRFGLKQASKIRAIDDYSASLVNSAFCSHEKLSLPGTDEVAGITKLFMNVINGGPRVEVALSDGMVLKGTKHASLTKDSGKKLGGRTLDLSDAYRQLAIAERSKWTAVLGVLDPSTGKPALFMQHALPFGSAASVYAFNRCSKGLWLIGTSLFSLAWSVFYDDFPHLEVAALQDSSWACAEALMLLLGFTFSAKPAKRKAFSTKFDALGVTFDLAEFHNSKFEIGHKEGRVQSICEILDTVLQEDKLAPPVASTLRGKLLFVFAFVSGRLGVPWVRSISERAEARHFVTSLSEKLKSDILSLMKFLREAKPRVVDVKDHKPPVLVFTDGACEGDQWQNTTCGGIILDPWSRKFEMWGTAVPQWLLEAWTDGVARQVIGQAEVLPIFIAKFLWLSILQGRQTIYFIDNYSSLDAHIKGSSKARGSDLMVAESQKLDVRVGGDSWYARVSSAGNPSDGPSRLDFESLPLLKMFKRIEVSEGCWEALRESSKADLKRKSRE